MKSFKLTVVAALLLASISAAQAHRQWVMPSSTQLEGKEPWVTVDVAVSENVFDIDTNALRLDGLSITGPDGAALVPEQTSSGKMRSSIDLKLAKPGTYRIALLSESAMASYKLNGETKRWRGNSADLKQEIPANAEELLVSRTLGRLETYVTAGKPNSTVVKSSGVGLELLPLSHPNDYQAGQSARFRFLLDGKPVPNLAVAIVPGGVRYRGVLNEVSVTTDGNGEFAVSWPMAQMYWINASYPPRVQVPEGQPRPAPPALRYNYGGTFEVFPQ